MHKAWLFLLFLVLTGPVWGDDLPPGVGIETTALPAGSDEGLGLPRLEVVSRPARAWVVLDGRRVGQTPLVLTVSAAGLHTLSLELEGRQRVEIPLELSLLTLTKVTADLPLPGPEQLARLVWEPWPETGRLEIGGAVWEQGPVLVAPGVQTVRLSRFGFEDAVLRLNLQAGKDYKVEPKWQAAALRVDVTAARGTWALAAETPWNRLDWQVRTTLPGRLVLRLKDQVGTVRWTSQPREVGQALVAGAVPAAEVLQLPDLQENWVLEAEFSSGGQSVTSQTAVTADPAWRPLLGGPAGLPLPAHLPPGLVQTWFGLQGEALTQMGLRAQTAIGLPWNSQLDVGLQFTSPLDKPAAVTRIQGGFGVNLWEVFTPLGRLVTGAKVAAGKTVTVAVASDGLELSLPLVWQGYGWHFGLAGQGSLPYGGSGQDIVTTGLTGFGVSFGSGFVNAAAWTGLVGPAGTAIEAGVLLGDSGAWLAGSLSWTWTAWQPSLTTWHLGLGLIP